jgi:CHAD domain-containing protein
VHIGLVKDASRRQRAGRREGLRQLLDDLKVRETRARSRLRKVVDRQFPRIVEELHCAFGRYTASVNEPLPQLRTVLSATIRNHVDELELTLNRVHSVADRADAHAARIAAKRLRYLLEPFADVDRTIARAVEKLTRLQDTLGTIHDAQTFAGEVAEAVALLADEDESSARKGLVHLSRRLHQMETAAFAVLQRGWLKAKRRPDIARVMSAMA